MPVKGNALPSRCEANEIPFQEQQSMHKLRLDPTETTRLILRLFSQRAYLKFKFKSTQCMQRVIYGFYLIR